MTDAANLGRDRIIRLLHEHGARDLEPAAGRGALQGKATMVSRRNFWVDHGKGQPDEARFTRLLLDKGADPNVRAPLRARLEEGHGGGSLREYRDGSPLDWGQRYDARIFVSREALRLLEAQS